MAVEGLPEGSAAAIGVSSARGYQHDVSETETIAGLPVGSYAVQALDIVIGNDRYVPSPSSQTITINGGATVTAQVAYVLATARLQVALSGIPFGGGVAVSLSGPGGYSHTLTGSELLTGLIPGTYQLQAPGFSLNGDQYQALPATQDVLLPAPGLVPVAVTIGYALTSGRLIVSVAGVPGDATAQIQVSGPGYDHLISRTDTLVGLAPGNYAIIAPSLSSGGFSYAAVVTSSVVVSASSLPATAQVSYALVSGALEVTLAGVPPGASASVSVSGPGGFLQALAGSQVLTDLTPGSYTITAAALSAGGQLYVPTPTLQAVVVSAELTPKQAAVGYALAPANLTVMVNGLPGGAPASVTVTGPAGYAMGITGTQTVAGLTPGLYLVAGGDVSSGGVLYTAQPAAQSVTLNAGGTSTVSVTYAAATGGLSVSISGLPGGTSAGVSVSGPAGFFQSLTGSQALSGVTPGVYSIAAGSVTSGSYTYAPAPLSQTKAVTGGATASAAVVYSPATGVLSITLVGLPGGVSASATLSGPGGFAQTVGASQTIGGLAPGNYTLSAPVLTSGGMTYTPAPPNQSTSIVAGTTEALSVSYSSAPSGGGGGLDLGLSGAYLTQATQRLDGSVPLVAGRDAYLRVFALASQANSAHPAVRVRLYNGATLVQTYTLAAPGASVPLAVDESSLLNSWNVLVPAALVQSGLRLLADVDPSNTVAEGDESNNQFPLSGTAANVDVRALPTFALRFVPVLQQVNGLQGNVSPANQEAFLADLKKLLPVGAYDADVRAPYTTTAPVLQSANGNLAWNTILSELLALRSADASARYYYGVVRVTYGSGVAGLGYVGGSAHTAMGWDYLPSATGVMAHEVGHNMGRLHAPCGGPSGVDPAYPYAGGQIGVWGLDLGSLALKAPTATDLMSYCGPNWVSDYNWSGMMAYRQGGPNNVPNDGGAGSGLLVWGRVTPAGIILEPAFQVSAAGTPPPRTGSNRLELLDADGSLLQRIPFETAEIPDLPGGPERHFGFVIPLSAGLQARLAGIRVLAEGRSALRSTGAAGGADPAPVLSRPNPNQIDLSWDAARFPVVMVRDAASGQVLSFARGGAVRLWARGQEFELRFSDGVRTVSRQARVLR